MTKLRKTNPTLVNQFYRRKKINKLFAGLGSVRIVKNCDLGLENAALGLRPLAAFSRPRSQFFTIRTDPKPANNIYYQICPGLTLIRFTWVSISVTKCLIALLLNFNITRFPEYRQLM